MHIPFRVLFRLVAVVVVLGLMVWWYVERRNHYAELRHRAEQPVSEGGLAQDAAASLPIDVESRTSDQKDLLRFWLRAGASGWDVYWPKEDAPAETKRNAEARLVQVLADFEDTVQRREEKIAPKELKVTFRRELASPDAPVSRLVGRILDTLLQAGVSDITFVTVPDPSGK